MFAWFSDDQKQYAKHLMCQIGILILVKQFEANLNF